ncbi:MAG: DUF4827 domain-containing protein [Candidatus Symbiothrix sp.]|jgi:hypothetical protein|nr:DUF4827 domain-containing protein [Candidatus Symbiothrix sp.]
MKILFCRVNLAALLRKNSFLIYMSAIVCFSYLFVSCNDQKSRQELLREEKKAIERFIAANGLVILETYPKNGVFNEKEYFKTNEGVYIHVVDSGNGVRALPRQTITVRYDHSWDVKYAVQNDSLNGYYEPIMLYPEEFKYGLSQTYQGLYSIVCTGWVYPLLYVGEHAIVDIIIPSSEGSYSDGQNVRPIFYKNLQYTSFQF